MNKNRPSLTSVINEHIAVINLLKSIQIQIKNIADRLYHCLVGTGKVLLMGNGGSAADCQHIAAELVVRYQNNRRALPAIALTTDTSILTASANDLGYDLIFARQIEALATSNDIVIGISTSGNSENVIQGFKAAYKKGAYTIGLTGKQGNKLKNMTHELIKVPSENTARIQEAHILIGHYLCECIEYKLLESKKLNNY
jgi:D-sedoheptulose 7-phosphate isomerase